MGPHADADDRDLGHGAVMGDVAILDFLLTRLDGGQRAGQFAPGAGEGEIGGLAVFRHVLNDHVHVHAGIGQRPEDGAGHARPVRHLVQGDLGFVAAVGDAGNGLLFHDVFLVAKQCAAHIGREGRKHAGRHPVQHGDFHRTGLQHLGAQGRHFQHLLIGDLFQATRFRDNARVGGIDAVHVGIDIAARRADTGGNRHSAGVGAAAAQGRDAGAGRHALESGDHGDLAILDRSLHVGGGDAFDAGRAMHGTGLDRHLPAQP